MAKGNTCKVPDCNKIVTQNRHTTCCMHFNRKRRHGSYNLPVKPKVGDKIVKICSIHGDLTISQVRETYKKRIKGKDVLPYPYMDAYCRECYRERMKANRLKRNYGLTPEQYNEMFTKQKGKCALCKEEEMLRNKSGKRRKLAVDHCHKIGKVRGLLCSQCNVGLGMFKESIKILDRAKRYLRRHSSAE